MKLKHFFPNSERMSLNGRTYQPVIFSRQDLVKFPASSVFNLSKRFTPHLSLGISFIYLTSRIYLKLLV